MRLRILSLGVAAVSLAAAPAFAIEGTTASSVKGGNPQSVSANRPAPKPAAAAQNPIAQKISSKPNLATKIQTMLPLAMTLDQASQGFKNEGEFIAALHVSQNLNIPFRQLRQQMVVERKSLGQSIQVLTSSLDAERAAAKAQRQANADLSEQ